MARGWLKLEAVKAIQDRQELHLKHLQDPNPLESDERWELETELKNALFLALRQFRGEPEFKNLNESLEDPHAAEIKELSTKNKYLDAKIEELEQKLSQDRGNQQRYLQQLNDLSLQEDIEFLTREVQTAQRERNEAVEAKSQIKQAKNRAEEAKKHAEENVASIRQVFERNENRKADLEKKVDNLETSTRFWRNQHSKSQQKLIDQNAELQRLQLRNLNNQGRENAPNNSRTASSGSRFVNTSSPLTEVSVEQAMQNLWNHAPRSTTANGTSTSSTSNANRHQAHSTSSSGSQPRQINGPLTALQTRIVKRLAELNDTQLEDLEPAIGERTKLHPGEHYHWVRGHWARDPGTKAFETPEDLQRKNKSHSRMF
ncbi:hypothetical protein N431DRAFT_491362 [Stipitochalara longipes BDJ]|nr:hypothetical protein N431DRAFT_491362 [Stipitochalara longipes BDJ]